MEKADVEQWSDRSKMRRNEKIGIRPALIDEGLSGRCGHCRRGPERCGPQCIWRDKQFKKRY